MAHSPQDKNSLNHPSNNSDNDIDNNEGNSIYMCCQDANLTRCTGCGIIQEGVKVTLSNELRKLFVERRRALITELEALEVFLGYSPTICQVRRWWKDKQNM